MSSDESHPWDPDGDGDVEADALIESTGAGDPDEWTSIFGQVSKIWNFLNAPNPYGYTLFGNPFAFIISAIAGFVVAIITGAWQYVLDFVVAISWPFEDLIEFLVATATDAANLVGVPIMELAREYNAVLRDIAMEAGPAAPIVLIGIYATAGAVVYVVVTRFVPYGRVISVARRVI